MWRGQCGAVVDTTVINGALHSWAGRSKVAVATMHFKVAEVAGVVATMKSKVAEAAEELSHLMWRV